MSFNLLVTPSGVGFVVRDKRYNSKKARRAWGISQVIVDLILGWFLKNTQMQTRGSTELLFKNVLYDVHKEKVWRS
jgi:hypothetical protein